MSYAQRNSISSPAAGLVLWCNDCGVRGELQTYNGTQWVSMVSGSASAPITTPTETITQITTITSSSLYCSANITDNGGSAILVHGIVWSTSPNPTTALSTKTVDSSSSIGIFTDTLTGLTPGTLYYIRAYATNIAGTSYTSDTTFTTVTTTVPILQTKTITSIATNSASSGGNILNDGGSAITAKGVVWSTNLNPTISLSTKTNNGSGTATYTSNMTNLLPNTLYHIRSYATNSTGTGYGADSTFTTKPLSTPTITTNAIINVTGTTAGCGGNISSDGGAAVTARGIVWSTSANPTTSLSTKTSNGSGTGSFSANMTGLSPATSYYVRAYAVNNQGTAYGSESTFTTAAPSLPTITTIPITSVTSFTASGGGSVTSDGGGAITARGVVWSTSSSPTTALSTKTTDGTGVGSFSSNISGLTDKTTYYYRAYATNVTGTSYGTELTFTTPQFFPSVQICNQIWMTKNLSVRTYRNGDSIPQITSSTSWRTTTQGAWCWYNNDSATYASKYGRLYNWYAVNDARGLAPEGWHIPTNSEWNVLIKCLDATTDTTLTGVQSNSAGGSLKSTDTALWLIPNTGATNSSGFTGSGGGMRTTTGLFIDIAEWGYYWSTNLASGSTTNAITRSILNLNGAVISSNYSRISGMSIRCIKD